MLEWTIRLAWKAGVGNYRGFESHSLRHNPANKYGQMFS